MTAKELNLVLVSLLPEIEQLYQDEVSWQEGDDTGAHVVYGDVLVPYIKTCAQKQDIINLSRGFDVVEHILSLKDSYAEEVIALSVLESLMFCDELKIDISKFFGEKTKKLYDEVKEWWESKK